MKLKSKVLCAYDVIVNLINPDVTISYNYVDIVSGDQKCKFSFSALQENEVLLRCVFISYVQRLVVAQDVLALAFAHRRLNLRYVCVHVYPYCYGMLGPYRMRYAAFTVVKYELYTNPVIDK